MANARTRVPRSLRIWRNSLRKMARKELHIASGRLSILSLLCGLLRQSDEDVLQGWGDRTGGGLREARLAQAIDQLGVIDLSVDQRMNGLSKDGRAGAKSLFLQPTERSRRLPRFDFHSATSGWIDRRRCFQFLRRTRHQQTREVQIADFS